MKIMNQVTTPKIIKMKAVFMTVVNLITNVKMKVKVRVSKLIQTINLRYIWNLVLIR